MKNDGYIKKGRQGQEKTQYPRHVASSGEAHRRVRDEETDVGENIISGRNAVTELLKSGRDIEKIYIQTGPLEGSILLIARMATDKKVPLIPIEKQRLQTLCGNTHHQGVVAVAAERNYSSVADILRYAEERGEPPFIVILDGVEDPHNLGAVIRSAECMGAHGVVIPKRRAAGLTPAAVKASAGAIEHIRVAKVVNISGVVDELKEKGVWVYGADMSGDSFPRADLRGPVAIVLGNEGAGISRLVREKCDFIISIPMFGSVNSLNVSAAAAVLLTEVAIQRHGGRSAN